MSPVCTPLSTNPCRVGRLKGPAFLCLAFVHVEPMVIDRFDLPREEINVGVNEETQSLTR